MPDDLHVALDEVRQLVLDQHSLVKATAGGRRRGGVPTVSRVELRPVDLNAGPRLQVVRYTESQAHTSNVAWGREAADVVGALVAEPFGHWHVRSTQQELSVRITKRGRVLVARQAVERHQERGHDRAKSRLVSPDEPFLQALGVTNPAGQIKTAKKDKYHQVEEFVRVLDAAVDEALAAGRVPTDRPLRVVDLGCGNAYLTFAAYRHLTGRKGLSVQLFGIDVKAQSREHNIAVAARLGWTEDIQFGQGTIAEAAVPAPVDIVLALHACDTATDDALARAVGWQAGLILAAPCCHHDVQRQLRHGEPAVPYGLITRHGLLRERLGDVLTDALRAHLLRTAGYRTDVIEFVGTEHTPRNVLLRAHRTGAGPSPQQAAEYEELVTSWGVTPYLATVLPKAGNS